MSILHCCASIEGMLRNFKRPGSLEGVITDNDTGRVLSDSEARETLRACLDKGWKVLPMCDCDNFDYQTGCKGHPDEKESTNEQYDER